MTGSVVIGDQRAQRATCHCSVNSKIPVVALILDDVPDKPVPLVHRRKTQAPPPWVIWEALPDPFRPDDRSWFDVGPGERHPVVLSETKPHTLVWSSIWTDRPQSTIEILIEPAGSGSSVTWTLVGPEGELDEAEIRLRRYRLDQVINGQLRDTFDQ